MNRVINAANGIGGSDCERIVGGALAQPVLALTSLAYVAAGVVVVAWAVHRRRLPAVAAGLALAAVGAGSFVYHGPQPSWAGPAHDWPIVVVVSICVVGVVRSGLRRDWSGWTVPAVLLALGLVAYLVGRTGSPLCRPESLWQFHGAWHVLTAAAATTALGAMMTSPMRSAPRSGPP